jgi:hypothetical protein
MASPMDKQCKAISDDEEDYFARAAEPREPLPRDAEESEVGPGAAAGVVDGSGADTQPVPPFAESDVCDAEHPQPCYFGGCSHSSKSWGALLKHVTTGKSHRGHGVTLTSLKGTYLHTEGTKELSSKRNARKKASKAAKAKAKPEASPEELGGASTPGGDTDIGPSAPAAGPQEAANGSAPAEVDFIWLPKWCLVKCAPGGEPVFPLEAKSLCGPNEHSIAVAASDNTSTGHTGVLSLDLVPASASIEQASASEPQKPSLDSADMLLHMQTQMDTIVQKLTPPDKSAWVKALPDVRIKKTYLEHTSTPAKGEGDTKRSTWPKEFKPDKVQVPGFRKYLKQDKIQAGSQLANMYNGVARVLGTFEITATAGCQAADATGPASLVSLYTNGEHKKLLAVPLLDPKYTWSIKTLQGLVHYCNYHIGMMTERWAKCEEGPWKQYINVIEQLIKQFQGGHMTKCQRQLQVAYQRKHNEDMEALAHFPQWSMLQPMVWESFLRVKLMGRKYEAASTMPKWARALSNTHTVGGGSYNTYIGRKWEYEHLDKEYMQGVLATNQSHIVCSQHKTSRTYGDLAKLLTPGNKELFKCYDSLPREGSGNLFFQPSRQQSECVSFPTCLRNWNKKNLRGKKVSLPTHNLLRKHFHNTLVRLTETKEKLKEVMVIIDAHSKIVMNKHYCISDPKEDAKLAGLLVAQVVGDTVPWPTDKQLDEALAKGDKLSLWLKHASEGSHKDIEDTAPEESDDEDEDSEELQWWECGEFFGVKPNALPAIEAPPELPPLQCNTTNNEGGSAASSSLETQVVPIQPPDTICKGAKRELPEPDSAMVEEPDASAALAGRASSSDSSRKRGRPSPFNPEEEAWLSSKQWDGGYQVPTFYARQVLAESVLGAHLRPHITEKQVLEFFRRGTRF